MLSQLFRMVMAAAAVGTCSLTATAQAQDAPPPKPAPVVLNDATYQVPDGTPEEIVAFLNNLQKLPVQFETQQAAIAHAIKVQRAIISAGDKILKQKTDEDTAYAGAEMKMEAIGLLAQAGIDGALKEALEAATALSKDAREDIAELGKEWRAALRVMSAPTLDDKEREALVQEYLAAIKETKYSPAALRGALGLGESLENHERQEVPAAYYEELSKVFQASGIEELAKYSEILDGTVRRLKLKGNSIEITGKTLDGKTFDWAPYKGKVVLVDFWATWCGPCLQELPNLKQNYEQYHAKGFEVVGVSLDDDGEKLASFLKSEEIPWVNLFAAPIDGNPQQPPAAAYYSISAVPTCILVNREGKVVSLNARGPELGRLLEELLGKPGTSKAPPAPSDK